MISSAEDLIKLHEGTRLKPYVDTVGKVSIGVGRNLTDRGISEEECEMLFQHDLESHLAELHAAFPWVASLDAVRHAVMVDLAFNLGLTKLRRFTRTLAAVKAGDYEHAARHLTQSLWYRQVKSRGARDVEMLRRGEWPDK